MGCLFSDERAKLDNHQTNCPLFLFRPYFQQTIAKLENEIQSQREQLREQKIILDNLKDVSEDIFYWIGTDGYTKPWQNPATNNKISITCQGDHYLAPPHILVDRYYQVMNDGDNSHSFCLKGNNCHVIFDLKIVKLNPTSYTLQHSTGWKFEVLRNWQLEGSNDKSHWDILVKHINDQSLKEEKGSMATWSISSNHFYSFFRIIVTGNNSYGFRPNMWISQFKLNGVIL